jgi:hypothetical protein
MINNIKLFRMPGRYAPASFLCAGIALALPVAPLSAQRQPSAPQSQPVVAQPAEAAPAVQPPASIRPTPGQLELSKLLWSTVVTVDSANRSGNYSVLRDLAAQSFQIQNNPARLAEIFAGIRNSRIDLTNALLVPPTYTQAPTMLREDVFRVTGYFQIRPVSLSFDMLYQWEQGQWKLLGIDIKPVEMPSRL